MVREEDGPRVLRILTSDKLQFVDNLNEWSFVGKRQTEVCRTLVDAATRNLALLSEMPCGESAGPGILCALRHASDDRRASAFGACRFYRDHAARRALAGTVVDA